MIKLKGQKGFLLITAVILIVIIGFFGGAVVYMIAGSADSSTKNLGAKQSLYLAESGLERGLYALIDNGTACSDINTTFPNPIAFGNGEFKITANYYKPDPAASLSSAIDSTTTTIPLTSAAGYAPQGRVAIDGELIDYSDISGNSLTGASRGKSGTAATAHSSGSNVIQDLCILQSTAGVPTIASPTSSHTVEQNLFTGLDEVSRAAGESGKIYRYDGSSWSQEADLGSNDLYWLTCINMSDCWAVGTSGKIYHYNGSSWSQFQDIGSTSLYGGTCVNADDCWAVGASGRIYHYNGSSWSQNADVGSYTLTEISCTSANDCWATGASGKIYHYNGSSWSQFQDMGSYTIYGLTCVSPSDCWAVGDAGKIYHYNGSSWSQNTDVGSQTLYEVTCVDPNDCWVVGEWGRIYHYNGSSWSLNQDVGTYTLRFVMCINAQDCWAVGDSGKIYHYDGSSWSQFQDMGSNDILAVSTKGLSAPTWTCGWKKVVS